VVGVLALAVVHWVITGADEKPVEATEPGARVAA